MSRIGRMPVTILKGVDVKIAERKVTVKGPLGELTETLPFGISAVVKDGHVELSAEKGTAKRLSALYGMSRARVNNMVHGVATGFSKTLEIHGLGFRAEAAGQTLTLALGKSHPVKFEVPKDIKIALDPKKTQVTLTGFNKDELGQTAANLRGLRPPEPYKGTGIRYRGEHVRKKAGKTAAGVGAGAGGKK